MTQEDIIREENEVIYMLIAKGMNNEAYDRAMRNVDRAGTVNSSALEGNCAYALGRAAHESGRHAAAIMAYSRAAGIALELGNQIEFGKIQISLATCFLETPEGDRKSNLEKAIVCQVNALKTNTEQSSPLDFAKLQFNMGYTYTELISNFGQPYQSYARSCFGNAHRAFRSLRMETEANNAMQAIRAIEMSNKIIPNIFRFFTRLFK